MTTSRLALVILLLVARDVAAGPYCGGDSGWTLPDGAEIPVGGRIAFYRENFYVSGRMQRLPLPKITAKLDGKPVKITTRDVRSGDHVIRYVDIKSTATGTLVLRGTATRPADKFHDDGSGGKEVFEAEYTIVATWTPPNPSAITRRYHISTREKIDRHRDGAEIILDIDALAFSVRWRRDDKDTWRTLEVPALRPEQALSLRAAPTTPALTGATLRLGQTTCGPDTIPLGLLEQGIELELSAKLADGRDVAVSGLPKPFVIAKRP